MQKYGEALRCHRELNNLSQMELSKHTGLSQQAISLWEKDLRVPSIANCIVLADFYGITLDELVGREFKEKGLE